MIQQLRLAPQIDLEMLWRHEGAAFQQKRPSAASQHLAAKMVGEAAALAKPIMFYDCFKIRESRTRGLVLEGGLVLHGGLVSYVMNRAQAIAVVVCTIGSALEQRVKQYFDAGQPAKAYILDGLGTVALGKLAERARARVESAAHARGLDASMPISPGHADWSLSEQQILFELVPTCETGVRLTSGFVMQPLKSLTMVLGLGQGMITHSQRSQCEYCSLRKACTYRQLPGDAWYTAASSSAREEEEHMPYA